MEEGWQPIGGANHTGQLVHNVRLVTSASVQHLPVARDLVEVPVVDGCALPTHAADQCRSRWEAVKVLGQAADPRPDSM